MNDYNELAMQVDDEPEIQALVDNGSFSNPEFPVLAYNSGAALALGIAVWRCDGHTDSYSGGDRM